MAFNGSGQFNIDSTGQPAVATNLITAAIHNALTADIATGLSNCITKDGQTTVTADIPFNTKKLTGIGAATARTDAASLATIQDGTGVYVGTVGGTADVITLTPSPAITAYVAGQTFQFLASGTNTTNVTVAVSGLAAKAITKNGTTALVAGDLVSGDLVAITYDGTRYILQSPSIAIPRATIDAKGDVLVGTADNTPAVITVGSNGKVLAADSNQTSGLKYVNVAGESFHGTVRNHPDSDVANTKIWADLSVVTTNDGHVYNPAQGLVLNTATTGSINGMQAAAVNSTWNKLYYARKRSDGSEGLWGLRAKNYLNDTSFTTARDGSPSLRLLTGTTSDKLAQGFQLATAGKVEFVDVGIIRANSPTGNVWFTIEADSSGNPSGTPLATSNKYDVSRLSTAAGGFVRFPFRTPATLSASTQYHLVFQGDYTRSDTVVAQWDGVIAGGYANGSAKQYNGSAWSAAAVADFRFKIYVTQNDTALSLPSGYDQYVQIGWFYIDGSGNIKLFHQIDRTIKVKGPSWKVGAFSTGGNGLQDGSAFFPPAPVFGAFQAGFTNAGEEYTVGQLTATELGAASSNTDWLDVSSNHSTAGADAAPACPITEVILIEYQGFNLELSASTTPGLWVSRITW